MKVVINTCFGGFRLSAEAIELLKNRKSEPVVYWMLQRNDPDLIAVVESLGAGRASGPNAELKIIEIPDDVKWDIKDYGGVEHVAENHRTWN